MIPDSLFNITDYRIFLIKKLPFDLLIICYLFIVWEKYVWEPFPHLKCENLMNLKNEEIKIKSK